MSETTRPWKQIADFDPDVYEMLESEYIRQQNGIELIASENFASANVIATTANVMANKYAEGLPAKRYYGGCEQVDRLEQLAIERACKLFGSKFANVQPHSGAQANAAAFLTLLKAGERILGLDLSHGGHLTHGSKVNFSGLLYDSHFYELDSGTERLDYDQILSTAKKVQPKVIVAGASAYARQIDFAKFRQIADEVGAYLLVDMAHIAGLVCTGVHPDPIPHAHVVTTTTHKTLRGPRGGLILWNDSELKFNKSVFPGTQGGPLEHIIAAKAVCFKEALAPEFTTYQKSVISNAKHLADGLMAKGFKLVSDGTDNHLCLIDLSETPTSGKDLEIALGKCAITVNKNTVPNEKRSPFVTSGIRVGTPAVTTRGMLLNEMDQIADWIHAAFANVNNDDVLNQIRSEVEKFAQRFPLYREWDSKK
jgi:glycine hydroxymethyltransferase